MVWARKEVLREYIHTHAHVKRITQFNPILSQHPTANDKEATATQQDHIFFPKHQIQIVQLHGKQINS